MRGGAIFTLDCGSLQPCCNRVTAFHMANAGRRLIAIGRDADIQVGQDVWGPQAGQPVAAPGRSSVEIKRDLPDHFERLLAVADQVDEVALTARELLDHIFGSGPNTCIRAVDFCGQKQDECSVSEVHGGSGVGSVSEAFRTADASTLCWKGIAGGLGLPAFSGRHTLSTLAWRCGAVDYLLFGSSLIFSRGRRRRCLILIVLGFLRIGHAISSLRVMSAASSAMKPAPYTSSEYASSNGLDFSSIAALSFSKVSM